MNDPWQILILDRHTATERDVKAAYARLLKQHRPDSDPEGFRRVREAYEAALDWLRYRATQTVSDVSYVDNPVEDEHAGEVVENKVPSPHADLPVVFEDFPLPADAQEALAEVERISQLGNTEQLEAALLTFHQRCEAGGVAEATRATALERAFQGREKSLASVVSNSFLIRLATGGHVSLPHLIISSWQEEDDRARLVQFSRALMDNARTLGTPEGAILLARVGVLTGLEQPEMASSLANAAYPHLPVEARQHLMAQLDQEAALGKLFAHVSPSMKPFWFKRLRDGGEGCDWNSLEARKAVNDIVERNRYVWEGWGVVRQLLPAANWAQVEQCLHHQAQQAASTQQRGSGFPGWIIIPAILIIINMLRFMANDKPAARSYSPPASSEVSAAKERERLRAKSKNTESSAGNFPRAVPAAESKVPSAMSLRNSMDEILSGDKTAPQRRQAVEVPRDPRPSWLHPMPPVSTVPSTSPALAPPAAANGAGGTQLQDLLQKGALQEGVLNQPAPPSMPGPLFQTR